MTNAETKMRLEIKVMMFETLISIMRDEKSENRDRLKAIELLEKILMTDSMLKGKNT